MPPKWLQVVAAPVPVPHDVPRVRGNAARTRSALFCELARALASPRYFGHSWDTLAGVLSELSEPLTVVVDNADRLLVDEPPGQFSSFFTVLARAAQRHPGLHVVLAAPAPHLSALRSRVTGALG
jgi:hypothetical protein